VSAVALLAACHSAPPRERPADPQPAGAATGESAPATVAGSAGAAPTASSAPQPTTPLSAATPIPAEAARQYADSLKLMKAGRTLEAEAALAQLAKSYPEFAGPEVNLGLLYLRGSHLAEAESAFKTALERNPANAVAGNELGITERRLGKFAEAETAYQRTIAAEPNYAPAYLNLGVLYDLYLAEPQKALEQFERYLQLAGENKQVAGWVVELRKRVGAAAPAAKKEPA